MAEQKPLIKPEVFSTPDSLSPLDHFWYSVKILMRAETSLMFMFIINFLVSLQYYILVTLIPLYFSSEHGYSDLMSGVIFGAFGIVIGLCSIYLSSIMHVISCERGLLFSVSLGILGFVAMMVNHTYLSLVSVLSLQAVSCSLSWPFVEYGIKAYSSLEIRNLSSSCYFMSNYLAGIVAGIFIDCLWVYIDDKAMMYRIVYSVGIIALVVAAGFIVACRNIANSEKEHMVTDGLIKQKRFWRYLVLIALLILLRSACFGHLDATLPKYMVRLQGKNAHFGVMLTIHSITMLLGVFFLTTLTFSFNSYNLIVAGGMIGALGSCPIIFDSEIWTFVIFVVMISIGESIWVPRLLDYTYSIAPDGQEGVYLAMSNCPFYFGMIITGASSGVMLDNFCPKDDLSECYMIWAIVFCTSVGIPIILVLLKNFIVQPEIEKENVVRCLDKTKDKI